MSRSNPVLAAEALRPQLHHGPGTRSVRVLWVLEELGVDFDLHPVLFPARVRQPDFLQVNPLGSLPALTHGEAFMTESMAICEYLAAVHGPTPLAVRPEEPGFADYRQFCWYGEASLTQPLGTILKYSRLEPGGAAPAAGGWTTAARLRPPARAGEPAARGERLPRRRPVHAGRRVRRLRAGLRRFPRRGWELPAAVIDYRARLAARPAYRRAYALAPAA